MKIGIKKISNDEAFAALAQKYYTTKNLKDRIKMLKNKLQGYGNNGNFPNCLEKWEADDAFYYLDYITMSMKDQKEIKRISVIIKDNSYELYDDCSSSFGKCDTHEDALIMGLKALTGMLKEESEGKRLVIFTAKPIFQKDHKYWVKGSDMLSCWPAHEYHGNEYTLTVYYKVI